MIFFDTNILIYSTIKNDINKQKVSDNLIKSAIVSNEFCISPLVLIEFVYVLSKFKINPQIFENSVELFRPFAIGEITPDLVFESFQLCKTSLLCNSINDVIHLKFAERFCDKIITYDNDFSRLKAHTNLEIQIITS
jgi:predicted nucleic acid-binding protein